MERWEWELGETAAFEVQAVVQRNASEPCQKNNGKAVSLSAVKNGRD